VKRSIAIIFILWHGLGIAQTHTAINYTISEGMPSNEVYEVVQDRQGFLWFGTDNGVIRYDGFEMLRLGIDEGLTDPVVFGFYEDHKGRMWFRTFTGKLCYYENGKVFRYKYNDVLAKYTSKSIISAIVIDSLDQLWFSTYRSAGVFGKIDASGNIEERYPDQSVIYCQEIGKNVLFGYQQKDLHNIQINGKTIPFKTVGSCEMFHVMAIEWRGKLYISECHNLYEYDGVNIKKVYNSNAAIISLSKDKKDNLWVGYSTHGADRFSSPEFKVDASPQFLKKHSVTRIFQDNYGALWASTLEQGIFHIPNIDIINYEIGNDDRIRLVASSETSIYLGTTTGDVFKTSPSKLLEYKQNFTPPLKALFVDSRDNIWVTSATQSYCYDNFFKINRNVEMPMSLTNAAEDKLHRIYAGGGGAMVVRLTPETGEEKTTVLPFMCRNVFILDTTLYLGTRNGLQMADLNFENIREIKSVADFKINRILKLNDTTLLLTTIGRGFMIFNTKTQQHINYNISSRFIANNIYAAVKQDENLWIGTENGLVKMSIQNLLADKPGFQIFGRHNGLFSNQVTNLAAQGNLIWIFGDRGFSVMNESNSNDIDHAPKFYLKNVRVNNTEVTINDSGLDLAFDQNNIEVNFGFISLDKKKIFNRHRLNKSETWNYTSLKYIQYYSLSPGSYEIQSEYSFDNIHWYAGYTSPQIFISPPLWKTWYFQLGIACILLILVYIFYRNQIRMLRRHQQKLIQSEIQTVERERTRIAKDLHDSVGTDFSAIKMVVSQSLRKHNDPIAEEVEGQFQHTIQEIKTIIYGLAPPGLERYGLMTGLKNYTEKINGKVPVEISINTFGKEIRDPALSISVFRIIQELISNSLKHADAKNISIHINAFEDLLSVVYEDNGKGFEWQKNSSGAGLYNIESRIQSLNGKLHFESSLYGVSYTIDIPLK
jgi:signal transduction histidine kinase